MIYRISIHNKSRKRDILRTYTVAHLRNDKFWNIFNFFLLLYISCLYFKIYKLAISICMIFFHLFFSIHYMERSDFLYRNNKDLLIASISNFQILFIFYFCLNYSNISAQDCVLNRLSTKSICDFFFFFSIIFIQACYSLAQLVARGI